MFGCAGKYFVVRSLQFDLEFDDVAEGQRAGGGNGGCGASVGELGSDAHGTSFQGAVVVEGKDVEGKDGDVPPPQVHLPRRTVPAHEVWAVDDSPGATLLRAAAGEGFTSVVRALMELGVPGECAPHTHTRARTRARTHARARAPPHDLTPPFRPSPGAP